MGKKKVILRFQCLLLTTTLLIGCSNEQVINELKAELQTASEQYSALQSENHHLEQRVQDLEETIKEYESKFPNPRTTLMGFDISLSLKNFRRNYMDEIRECKKIEHSDKDIGRKYKIPMTECVLKEKKGFAHFYKETMYWFVRRVESEKVKMWVAIEEIEKKSGVSAAISPYGGTLSLSCGAKVNFHTGEVIAMSRDVMVDTFQGSVSDCSKVITDYNVRQVEYRNTSLESQVTSDLVATKETTDRNEAKGKLDL